MTAQSGLRGHRVQNVAKAEGRRREILVAAAHVFARDGYATASLDDVAVRIGVTKGVIYYYFRSKEEILTEILATAIGEATERLDAIVSAGRPAEETLEAAVHDLVSHIFDDLDRAANVLRAGERLSVESSELVRTLQRRFEGMFRQIIGDGIRQGVFADHDPKIMTFTILRACLGVADWYSSDGPLAPEVIARQVTDQAVAGVLQRRPAQPA